MGDFGDDEVRVIAVQSCMYVCMLPVIIPAVSLDGMCGGWPCLREIHSAWKGGI